MKATPSRATNAAPAQWAEESCRVVASDGFYSAGHKIDTDYAKSAAPVLKERLSSAGRRLPALGLHSMRSRRLCGGGMRHACLLVGERFCRLQGRGQPLGLDACASV